MKVSGRDRRWLDVAAGVALASDCVQRVGAVVVAGGNPVGRPNRSRRAGCAGSYPWSVHAEEHALRAAGVFGATLYVARWTPGGRLGLSKPCRRCVDVLVEFRVRRVVWTADRGGVGQARLRELVGDSAFVG